MRNDDLLDALERAARLREQPTDPVDADPVDSVLTQIRRESTDLKPIPLPSWPRLSRLSRLLRPGGLSVVGGAPGTGKSFFALALGLACDAAGEKWAYLPLESSRTLHLRRMAAMLDRSFDPLVDSEDDPEAARKSSEAVERVRPKLREVARSIFANPSAPDESGAVRAVTPDYVLRWAETQFDRGCRVAVFDPLAAVDFGGGHQQWTNEKRFIRGLVGLSMRHEKCVVMISHTVKKLADPRRVEVGDLQSGADIGRLASSVILIRSHSPALESRVFRSRGLVEDVAHNRSMVVAKSRHAEGGSSIAFDFGHDGPVYRELGILAPKHRVNPRPPDISALWSPYSE